MSTWWIEFKQALQSRLTGDATLVALLANSSSIYQEVGSPETASMYPYVICRMNLVDPVHAQGTDMNVVTVDVQSRLGMKQKYGTDNPDVRADLIHARIYGDWYANAGGLPTYGLHKWAAGALSSGFTAGSLVRTTGPIIIQEDNVFGLSVSFQGHISKQAA